MKVERIAFRFQKGELRVLMKLLGIASLPGTETDAAADENLALQGLIDDEIVQAAGADTMLVDRTVSLILLNAAAYTCCGMVETENARMVLFKGKLFDVILGTDENGSSLCPVKEWEQACRQFMQEIECARVVRFAVTEKGAEANWREPQEDFAEAFARELSRYSGREG